MKYEVIIYWSDADNVFVAEVPDLPGCMTHGSTYEEAARNVQEAMAGWLKSWADLGRPVPQPRQRALSA